MLPKNIVRRKRTEEEGREGEYLREKGLEEGGQKQKRVRAYWEENHNRPRSMWSSLQTVQLG